VQGRINAANHEGEGEEFERDPGCASNKGKKWPPSSGKPSKQHHCNQKRKKMEETGEMRRRLHPRHVSKQVFPHPKVVHYNPFEKGGGGGNKKNKS